MIVSHLHGDHVGGLPFLLLDAAYNRPRAEPLVVAGPPGIEACVLARPRSPLSGYAGSVSTRVPVRFVELEAGVSCRWTACSSRAIGVEHSAKTPCLAHTCGGRWQGDRLLRRHAVDAGARRVVARCGPVRLRVHGLRPAALLALVARGAHHPCVRVRRRADGAHAPWSAHAGTMPRRRGGPAPKTGWSSRCDAPAVALDRRHRTAGSRSHGDQGHRGLDRTSALLIRSTNSVAGSRVRRRLRDAPSSSGSR